MRNIHPHQLGFRCMDILNSSIHTSSMRDAPLRRVASTPVSKLLHHGRAKEIAKQVTIHHHSIAVVPSISFPIASRPESRTPFLFQIWSCIIGRTLQCPRHLHICTPFLFSFLPSFPAAKGVGGSRPPFWTKIKIKIRCGYGCSLPAPGACMRWFFHLVSSTVSLIPSHFLLPWSCP